MWLSLAGGFMGMVIRISQLFLMRYQGFTLTKSMVKKLYSKRAKTDYDDRLEELENDNCLTDPQR